MVRIPEFTQVSDYCSNEACADYGKRQSEQQKNIVKYGKTKVGRQRYLCRTCGKTFTENLGTFFYCRHTPGVEIIGIIGLLIERNRISSIARVKGYKEDAILACLRDAAKRAEVIEEEL